MLAVRAAEIGRTKNRWPPTRLLLDAVETVGAVALEEVVAAPMIIDVAPFAGLPVDLVCGLVSPVRAVRLDEPRMKPGPHVAAVRWRAQLGDVQRCGENR